MILEEERKETARWYENLSLEDAKVFIQQNIAAAARSFIAVGYYLKQVRDRELFREDGHETIWAFARMEYGISKSTASRYMAINDRFSIGGNSPIVKGEYQDFSRSQLQEMLYLTDDQLERVKPEVSVLEIRQMRQGQAMNQDEDIPGQFRIEDFPEYMPTPTTLTKPIEPTPEASVIRQGTFQISVHEMVGGLVATSQQEGTVEMQQSMSEIQKNPNVERSFCGMDLEICPASAGECCEECCEDCLQEGCMRRCLAAKRPFCLRDTTAPVEHRLKILPKYFNEARSGRKTFEIRKDERNIQVGDTVILEEFDGMGYTGKAMTVTVSYVLRDCESYGLMARHCIFCWEAIQASTRQSWQQAGAVGSQQKADLTN